MPKPSKRGEKDKSDDIHLYTRVQMVDVRFQIRLCGSDNQSTLSPAQGNKNDDHSDTSLSPQSYAQILPFGDSATFDPNSSGQMYAKRLKCSWLPCGYNGTFTRSAELKRHVRKNHTNLDWYACSVEQCDSVYTRQSNLINHMRGAH